MKRPGAKRPSPQVPDGERCKSIVRDYKTKQHVRCTRRATGGDQWCNLHDPSKHMQRQGESRRRHSMRRDARTALRAAERKMIDLCADVAYQAMLHVAAERELATTLGVPYASNPLSEIVRDWLLASADRRELATRYDAANLAVRTQGRATAVVSAKRDKLKPRERVVMA